jgi:hypothetical protein
MRRDIGCNAIDHAVSRRAMLAGSAAATAVGVAGKVLPAETKQLKTQQKRILQIFLQGGVSQLESWDPKPGTRYGGPFRAIETSVPGIRISELLPHIAQRMHHLSIVRSIDIKINNHKQAQLFMERGRRAGVFPYIGTIAAKYLAPKGAALPGYMHVTTRGLDDNTNAFLPAEYGQLKLPGAAAPENLKRPDKLTAEAAKRRNELRQRLSRRFSGKVGQPAFTDSYDSSYTLADKLLAKKGLFEGEPPARELERYGSHPFGRNCILARKLLEAGSTCVKVTHHGYDTHAENFNFHLEQLAEFDKTFCMLLDDLHDSGMLDSTLVLIMSEFGRTPKINQRYGRDHWGTAWSIALGGCGIKPGVVIGKTNDEGTEVADRKVDGSHLFHTYFQALGLDTTDYHDMPGRAIPIGDPAAEAIGELLS